MNKRLHDILYPYLIGVQGPVCANKYCNNKENLVIDHIDNNNSNNNINNLQLLCRSCNTKKNHPRTTEPNERAAPPEYSAGKRNFKLAKKYIYGRLWDPAENNGLNLDELIDDVAAYVDCSQTQVKNYLKKLCSKKHGLCTTEERSDGIYLVWKNDEELNEVFKIEKA